MQKRFIRQYPTESKCSLIHMAKMLISKDVSKYDQISMWATKTLPRRMLHYAMQDAYLPFLLRDKLEAKNEGGLNTTITN